MKNWLLLLSVISGLTLSCNKEGKDLDKSSFIGTQYMGTYNTVTHHPFGDPPPSYTTIDSLVTNVHFNDGYIAFFGDSIPLSQIEWGEDCYASSGSGYFTIRFWDEGDSMAYYRMQWSGPSGASHSKSFSGKKIE